MKLEDIQKDLKNILSPKRFHHSEGVAAMGKHLAEKYGADPEKAYVAGWVHDCAKELTLSEMQDIVKGAGLSCDDYLLSSRALLHGPAGSVLAETKYGIHDAAIKGAIYYHTTGRKDMTLLEKIIFLADYIEPSRDFPGVERLRALAYEDLDAAVLLGCEMSIQEMAERGLPVHPNTVKARDWLRSKTKGTSD